MPARQAAARRSTKREAARFPFFLPGFCLHGVKAGYIARPYRATARPARQARRGSASGARRAAAGERPGVFIAPAGPARPAERATQRNP
ncbi:hypothetical protein BURCENBC7_AP3545 [Burkholderia cenocepacia BC7]|nr:hypothetical protein BURCENK562V_C2752 [Burkholderia cenocepacia K56-2Valvano]ERI28741.1 hypothetical protein BURCENBC7_AP3545 [Burkholderia cenocepacia BC7]